MFHLYQAFKIDVVMVIAVGSEKRRTAGIHKTMFFIIGFLCYVVISKSASSGKMTDDSRRLPHPVATFEKLRNFVTNFRKILEICKLFEENQVNEKGNVPRRAVIHTTSDMDGRVHLGMDGGVHLGLKVEVCYGAVLDERAV